MIILPIEDGLNYASSHVAVMPIMDKNWAIKDQLNAASPLFIIMHFHGNTFQVCNWKHKTSKFWNRVKAMIFFFTNNPLVEAGGMQPSAVSVDQHQNSSECVFMTWPLARGRGHSWQLGALIQLTQLLLQLFHCKHFQRNYRLALLLLLHL